MAVYDELTFWKTGLQKRWSRRCRRGDESVDEDDVGNVWAESWYLLCIANVPRYSDVGDDVIGRLSCSGQIKCGQVLSGAR